VETTGQTDKLGTGTQVQLFLWYCPATIIFFRRAKIFRQPYLLRQGRFAHLKDEDFDYFQSKIDEM